MPVSAAAAQDAAAAAAVAAALAAIRATDAGDAEEPGGAVERGFAFASDAQCSEFAAHVASGRARASCAVDFPYADDYASFIPGILFVVVLLLAFVAWMNAPFQFFVQDIYNAENQPYFARGALFWKFLRDGLEIAFYPVFGEVVFFYLLYQDVRREEEDEDIAEAVGAEAGDDDA